MGSQRTRDLLKPVVSEQVLDKVHHIFSKQNDLGFFFLYENIHCDYTLEMQKKKRCFKKLHLMSTHNIIIYQKINKISGPSCSKCR